MTSSRPLEPLAASSLYMTRNTINEFEYSVVQMTITLSTSGQILVHSGDELAHVTENNDYTRLARPQRGFLHSTPAHGPYCIAWLVSGPLITVPPSRQRLNKYGREPCVRVSVRVSPRNSRARTRTRGFLTDAAYTRDWRCKLR